MSLVAVDGAPCDPAAAAAAISSITQRMLRRALPAAPAAPQSPTGRGGPYIKSARLRSPQRSLARSAPGTSRFWLTRYSGRGNPHHRRHRPERMLFPDYPTPSGCDALRPASARLPAGGAGLVRAAVRRCSSSPSLLGTPPLRVPCPPPAPAPSPHRLPPPQLQGLEKRDWIYCGAAWPALRLAEAETMRAQSSGARTRGSEHLGTPCCG